MNGALVAIVQAVRGLLVKALAERLLYRYDAAQSLYDAAGSALAAVASAIQPQDASAAVEALEQLDREVEKSDFAASEESKLADADAIDALLRAVTKRAGARERSSAVDTTAEKLVARVDAAREAARAFTVGENAAPDATLMRSLRLQATLGGADCSRLLAAPVAARERLTAARRSGQEADDEGKDEAVALQEFLLELCCGDGSEGSGQGSVAKLLEAARQMRRDGAPGWALRQMGGWNL